MIVSKIKKSEYKVSEWSGGSTTELAIFPENADYSKREFLWRISSAKVELDKSSFTPLPGVQRIIMPLDGDLKLNHIGQRESVLHPFQQDSFPGDWQTKSEGKVQDFNVMCQAEAEANLEHFSLEAGERLVVSNNDVKSGTILLFCYRGKLDVIVAEEYQFGNEESLLIQFDEYEEMNLVLESRIDSELLVVWVRHTIS